MNNNDEQLVGMGDPQAYIRVFIQNIPQRQPWTQIEQVEPLPKGEIAAVGQDCGNGWRKVFNVYAKWLFAMRYLDGFDKAIPFGGASSWQVYRDNVLLQARSKTSLLFSEPSELTCCRNNLNIVMGRTYAKNCSLTLDWLDHEFAYQLEHKVIVCPYFDYRQLSNSKIIKLCEYIEHLGLLEH